MPLPGGKQGFLVSCDGSAGDWTRCYEAATVAPDGAALVATAMMLPTLKAAPAATSYGATTLSTGKSNLGFPGLSAGNPSW